MKKLFLLISLLSCLQLNAYKKMPSDRELVAQTIKPFSILGIGLGAIGLAYSGFLQYQILTTPPSKGRFVCNDIKNFIFKASCLSTVLGAGLYKLSKHLENKYK